MNFFQMGLFVLFTIFLYQKGSSESKDPESEAPEECDREPDPKRKGAPWPVRAGGIWLYLYKRSLTIALFFFFLLSWTGHLYGSFKHYNTGLISKGKSPESLFSYLGDPNFWFESMQNWQSEFLSVFALVFMSIYLRQKGSPQSKPVDKANGATGE